MCITNYRDVADVFAINRRKNYERARLLYAKALRAMEARGPDVQLLLFAFAVFCLVTGVSRLC